MNHITYLKSRFKFLIKNKTFRENFLLISFRVIILLILKVLNIKRNFIGKFGNKSFKFFFDPRFGMVGGRGYFLYRQKQEDFLNYASFLISKGDVVIDCGANQGIFSLSLRTKVGMSGKIYAIEPFKRCINIFKKNLKINNYQNIHIINAVVSDKLGTSTIDFSEGITSASLVNKIGDKKKIVKSITIDHLIKKHKIDKLNLLKIDVEGAEFLVISGSIKAIKKFKPIIYLECYYKRIFDQIFNKIKKFNYEIYYLQKNKLVKVRSFNPKISNYIYISK